jgi:hypothetical protein
MLGKELTGLDVSNVDCGGGHGGVTPLVFYFDSIQQSRRWLRSAYRSRSHASILKIPNLLSLFRGIPSNRIRVRDDQSLVSGGGWARQGSRFCDSLHGYRAAKCDAHPAMKYKVLKGGRTARGLPRNANRNDRTKAPGRRPEALLEAEPMHRLMPRPRKPVPSVRGQSWSARRRPTPPPSTFYGTGR